MRIFFEKKFIVAFFFGLASAMAFCAGTKRVSATKNRISVMEVESVQSVMVKAGFIIATNITVTTEKKNVRGVVAMDNVHIAMVQGVNKKKGLALLNVINLN